MVRMQLFPVEMLTSDSANHGVRCEEWIVPFFLPLVLG